MKKFILLFCLLTLPLFLSAREVVRLTRFDGKVITGVSAGHMFEVELVKSDVTKAVVEIDGNLENYLRFELEGDGTVVVEMDMPRNVQRQIEQVGWKNRTLKLKVYLPECRRIKLTQMSKLTSADDFEADEINIETRQMARIDKLSVTAGTMNIIAGQMSQVRMHVAAGALTVKAAEMAKVNLRGKAQQLTAQATDMAKIQAGDLYAANSNLTAGNMAEISVFVTDYLYARASNMGSVNYKGSPPNIDLKTPRRTVYCMAN